MAIETRYGNRAPVMGCPMGVVDISENDFSVEHPDYPDEKDILFGIDPEELVTLTVTNELGQEVEQTFQAGPNPYYIKKIKADAAVAVKIHYFI